MAVVSIEKAMSHATEKAKPGRKPLPPGEGKADRLEMRVNPADRAQWQAKADAAGMKLTQWMQDACNRSKR